MDQLFDSTNSNHSRAFNAIDLLSPSSDTPSTRNRHVYSLLPGFMYPRGPPQAFTSVMDTYNSNNPDFTGRISNNRRINNSSRTSRSSFTEPTIESAASTTLQSSAASPQATMPASNSEHYTPQQSYRPSHRPSYNPRTGARELPCTRPRTRSRTVKECSTVPSTTSSKNTRECPRPNKRRKLEPTTDIQSTVQCCICLEQPLVKDLAKVNGCEHRFCFNCIETWADRENTCPLCKIRFTQIERCFESKENKLPSKNAVKKVKFRDQRTDSGRSIQHLLANIETGSTIANIETGSMGAALTQLLLSGLHNSHGGFVTYAPHGFRRRSHTSSVWHSALTGRPAAVPNNDRSAALRPLFDSLNDSLNTRSHTRSQRPYAPISNADRTTASDLILLDDVDETIFDAETNSNTTSSFATGAITFPTGAEFDVENILDTEDQVQNYNFAQRVRNISRNRDRVMEQFQYNDRNSAYNIDAGDSAENALEIFDDSDQDDVVEVVGEQT